MYRTVTNPRVKVDAAVQVDIECGGWQQGSVIADMGHILIWIAPAHCVRSQAHRSHSSSRLEGAVE